MQEGTNFSPSLSPQFFLSQCSVTDLHLLLLLQFDSDIPLDQIFMFLVEDK